MCKFIQIKCNLLNNTFTNLRYIPKIQKCFCKYSKYLVDDYSKSGSYPFLPSAQRYLWAILDYYNNFMGFVYLDNFVGNGIQNYSAELTTCFEKKAWGNFTRYSAKLFLKKVFDDFGLYKIRALIYPDNFRVASLLKSSGFKYETTIPKETFRNGKPQDIDLYGIYRTYYYKDEVKND
ncbi:GNAT family N-acetyltransferase [bacterium]|nr:GNAT family N-acetyltransferase [bacterium]